MEIAKKYLHCRSGQFVLIGLAQMLEQRIVGANLTAGVRGWFVVRDPLSILRNMKEICVPVLRVVEMMREGAL